MQSHAHTARCTQKRIYFPYRNEGKPKTDEEKKEFYRKKDGNKDKRGK
jgi:hypothetical protein